jgi:hypothetical protein
MGSPRARFDDTPADIQEQLGHKLSSPTRYMDRDACVGSLDPNHRNPESSCANATMPALNAYVPETGTIPL